MSKRILSMILTLTLVLGSMGMVFADTDTVSDVMTPAQKIAELQRLGFIKGDDSGDLKLEDAIKRSETAIIVSKAVVSGGQKADMDAVEKEIERSRYESRFSDVPTSYRSNPYINVAVQEGIIAGYPDGTFRPDRDIKYSEVITMMVNILGEKPNVGVKYPDNYIGKARELGLLEGINVNYVGQAQRQGVFELLYNTLTNNKVGNYNIDKVLVLENDRVESIGTNEIVVEVIKEVQRTKFADDSRSGNAEERRGQQLRITLPADTDLDVEDLVGKVVDLSYDKSNKAVRAQLDNSYSYVSGEITTDGDKLVVGRAPNERSYTATMDEKLTSQDDRVFRTYVNDKAYTYKNFANDVKKADFANVTIKNGKVLFIDAFNFDDVAPVKEVKKDGAEVFVYNDARDGDVKRIDFKADKTKVVAIKDGKISRIKISDIDELDVVHVYGDNKVLVRQDSKVDGDYKKVSEDKYGHFVTVGDEAYEISGRANQQAVYSYDSKKFYTLDPKGADRVLREFKDEKVTLLLDVNNKVQYFGSEIEAGEFVAGIDSIVGKDLRVIKADGKADLSANLDTKVKLEGSTSHQNLNKLNKKDIVYIASKEKDLSKVYRLVSATKAIEEAKLVAKDGSKYDFDEKNYINIKDDKEYKVLERTNVFYYDGDKVVATTLKDVKANQDVDKALKAYIITDKAYDTIVTDSKRPTTGLDYVANTIVFTETSFKNETSTEIVHVTGINAVGDKYELEYKDVDGTKTTKLIEKDSKAHKTITDRGLNEARKALVEAIVELKINKDDAKEISVITERISSRADVYKVVRSSSNSGYRQITLADRNGVEIDYWTNTNVKEFGNVGTSGSKVSFSTDGRSEIEAMIVRPSNAALSAWDGSTVKTNVLQEVIETGNIVLVRIDGKMYQYAGNVAEAKSFEGKEVTFDLQVVNGVEYALNLKLKDVSGTVTKTDLINTIVDAKAVDTTGKTAASVKILEDAIKAAESVRDNANATQVQVNNARVAVNSAIAGLEEEVLKDNEIEGDLQSTLFGMRLDFEVTDGTKVTEVTLNGDVLSAADFDYGITKNKVSVNDVVAGDEVTVTVDGKEFTVKF